MRNREQIYGQEAAGLLRNITVYHCMRRDQLLRLCASMLIAHAPTAWKAGRNIIRRT